MIADVAIRKVIADFTEAYNAGDWNRIQNIFDEDLVDMSAGAREAGQKSRPRIITIAKQTASCRALQPPLC